MPAEAGRTVAAVPTLLRLKGSDSYLVAREEPETLRRRLADAGSRGLAACKAEWRLITATHNLLKLWRTGLATA
jgi:hypothetical protein